jgi:aminomethyltransferase
MAVRNNVGLFDISHMGEIEIRGDRAVEATNRLATNDVSTLEDGDAQYAALCNEEGGIVDDLVLYRLAEDRIFICVNAANRQKDYAHMEAHAPDDVVVDNRSDAFVQLALQGPEAESVLEACTDLDLPSIEFYASEMGEVAGVETLVSRTGYTGEDGFELYVPAEEGDVVFDAVREAGEPHELAMCGLGARDTLRLEVMYNLYGQDMTEANNPYEARLGWIVSLDKDVSFVGEEALRRIEEEGPEKKLRGLRLLGRGVLRSGYEIYRDDRRVGTVTSGTHSPLLEESIGLGYIDAPDWDASEVEVEIRGRRVAAEVTSTPFYSSD